MAHQGAVVSLGIERSECCSFGILAATQHGMVHLTYIQPTDTCHGDPLITPANPRGFGANLSRVAQRLRGTVHSSCVLLHFPSVSWPTTKAVTGSPVQYQSMSALSSVDLCRVHSTAGWILTIERVQDLL